MDTIKTIRRYNSASFRFLRGASRIVDMYGKLDEYRPMTDDVVALKDDWNRVGDALYSEIHNYERETAQ
jgi:hypothetical protein